MYDLNAHLTDIATNKTDKKGRIETFVFEIEDSALWMANVDKCSQRDLFAMCYGPQRRPDSIYSNNLQGEGEQRAALLDALQSLRKHGVMIGGEPHRCYFGGGIDCEAVSGRGIDAYVLGSTFGTVLLIVKKGVIYERLGMQQNVWRSHYLSLSLANPAAYDGWRAVRRPPMPRTGNLWVDTETVEFALYNPRNEARRKLLVCDTIRTVTEAQVMRSLRPRQGRRDATEDLQL